MASRGKLPVSKRVSTRRRRAVRPGAAISTGPSRLISATEAARSFSDLLNRIQYRGERFVVERGGAPVCEITPATVVTVTVTDLVRALRSGPRADPEYLDLLEEITRTQPKVERSPWER